MYLKIETDADILEFEKYIDVSDLTVDFIIEPFVEKKVVYGTAPWQRTDTQMVDDDMIIKKALNGRTFGKNKLSLYADRANYRSSDLRGYSIGYDNASISFDLTTSQVRYSHLRKNNVRPITIMKEDGKKYLRIKWNEVYSEIIRINGRNNKTETKANIKHMGSKWKIQCLLGKLDEDGVSMYKEYTYGMPGVYSPSAFGHEFRIYLRKNDPCVDINITNDEIFDFDTFGIRRDVTYTEIVNTSKLFQTFLDGLKPKTESDIDE